MRGGWRVGRLLGIDIYVDPSWIVILVLMVYTLGFVELPMELAPLARRPRPDIVSISAGLITALLLFACVLAHELAHSWMALERHVPVNRITLFIFGGAAQIAREPDRPSSEFLIAIMGPLLSAALAAVFAGAWLWLRILDSTRAIGISLAPMVLVTALLAQSNGALAVFNLAPGFPLDGGRIFRAILWAAFKDVRRATAWSCRAGQALALLMILAGIWLFLTELEISGLWYLLIGVFLWNAARDALRQITLRETLVRVAVCDIMSRGAETIPSTLALSHFVDRFMLSRRDQTFIVADGVGVLGILSSSRVCQIPRDRWPVTSVAQILTPLSRAAPLAANQSVASALERFVPPLEELPVMADGQVVGFLSRNDIVRYLKVKS